MTEAGQVVSGNPIINDPFAEPTRHWYFSGLVPEIREGRRTAGYLAASPDGELKITDEIIGFDLVNDIRDRVRAWREEGYPGTTALTRDLLRHWFDDDRRLNNTRPFFCQQEAIETVVFLTEAPADRKVGIAVPPSGEAYTRWAVKMATGSGKTLVMALIAAWSGLNKVTNRQDARFSDQILVVSPNITVRDRLVGPGGLDPKHPESVYAEFDLIPPQYSGLIGQFHLQVMNWHQLAPKEDPKRSVVRRGRESDAAFCRRVLDGLSPSGRVLVLNDEAHHAYRFPEDIAAARVDADEVREATVWIDGLERIHRHREILRAVDCSATPMFPSSFKEHAWTPFPWIISDFALVDAIESGLVKIPRTPTDDNTGEAIPKYRRLWDYIKETLPKRNESEEEAHPLTDYLAEADGPLKQLAGAWEETFVAWEEAGRSVPPVMIVICHDTNVARMIDHHIAVLGEASPDLVNPTSGPPVTLRIDTDALGKAESGVGNAAAEEIRELVSTVGKPGKPGANIRCLVSVAMLSEGWDARNVTQILGLRAFQSQLLCEQVVGRGLRRSDYSNLSEPEYVDVYGVPFQLLPMARYDSAAPSKPPDYTTVYSMKDRAELKVSFPRIVQVVPDIEDTLDVDFDAIEPIRVTPRFDPTDTWVEFDLGTPHAGLGGEVQDRDRAYEHFRIQRLLFRVAAGLIQPYDKPWLFPQALEIAQRVIRPVEEGGKVAYAADVDPREICNLRYLTLLRERLGAALRPGEGPERFLPALDEYQPIGSTEGLNFAAPTDRCVPTAKSHLSHAVCDSGLERRMCAVLDANSDVICWVKNHKLFLEIPYLYMGLTYRYRPDFVVHLKNGLVVLLEGKGDPDEKDDAKATAARRWVEAVNTWGGLGTWVHDICYDAGALSAQLDASTPANAAVWQFKGGAWLEGLEDFPGPGGCRCLGGVELDHQLGTLDLLRLPLSFSQSRLLDPSDFVKEAAARGVSLRVEHLAELHRRRILVPFFQLLRHPRRSRSSVAEGLQEVTYRRGALDGVLEAAHQGSLIDPGSERFIPWRDRDDMRRQGPAVYYSEHQLLGVQALERAVVAMEGSWSDDHKLTVTLRPPRPEAVEQMHRGRALAILLTALDSHYLPNILRVISGSDEWFEQDSLFDLEQRLLPFNVTPEAISKAAEALIFRAHSIDPLGDWYKLVGLAHPESWKGLKKEARLAMDFRVAAEVLLQCLDDLGREDLSKSPEATGRMAWAILDERLPANASSLDRQLMSRGLSPHPSLLLALEGKTEMMLMPRVMAQIFGAPVPDRLVELVFMDTVNRDLDLLVRHTLAPRFGRSYGDFVILERPPTRIMVAVDPEKDYSTPEKQEAERQKLARRLFETLPSSVQSPQAREDIDTLVTVTTWETGSWEFANFTDLELAKAIMTVVALPEQVTIDDVRARVTSLRSAVLAANIEHATTPWGAGVNKVKLAEALWPVLRRKVRRRLKCDTLDGLPAARVAKTALELAMQTHRRGVGLRTGGSVAATAAATPTR